MVDKIKIALLLILAVLPSFTQAEKMYADEIFAEISYHQDRIDRIREGVADAQNYFNMDELEALAYETSDPQGWLDYMLARYYRTVSKLNYAGAEIADEVSAFLYAHKDDGALSPVVIDEGIAKYAAMSEFFIEFANEQYQEYIRLWDTHTSKYGDIGRDAFQDDNDFLLRYGVVVIE